MGYFISEHTHQILILAIVQLICIDMAVIYPLLFINLIK